MQELKRLAKRTRLLILESLFQAGSGHLAGSLSLSDILVTLYFGGILRYLPKNPWWERRDRLILSPGHTAPALYTVLALAGFFEISMLKSLRKLGSPLEGHPIARSLPGVEATTGSLGQGIGVACGIAKALLLKYPEVANFKNPKLKEIKSPRVFCIISDGELQEGSVWEAFMFSKTHQLNNILFILDKNDIQNSGYTSAISKMEPLEKKFMAFGLDCRFANGHNFESLFHAFENIRLPGIIIAKTTACKGIGFLENKYEWHAKPLTEEIFLKAKEELSKAIADD